MTNQGFKKKISLSQIIKKCKYYLYSSTFDYIKPTVMPNFNAVTLFFVVGWINLVWLQEVAYPSLPPFNYSYFTFIKVSLAFSRSALISLYCRVNNINVSLMAYKHSIFTFIFRIIILSTGLKKRQGNGLYVTRLHPPPPPQKKKKEYQVFLAFCRW